MDTKVKDLVSTAIGQIHELSDADTKIGDPIKIDGNITINPVSKVSYGFAAGTMQGWGIAAEIIVHIIFFINTSE